MIYLASTSPRRKQLLRKAGLTFRILRPDYEEKNNLKAGPSKIVRMHAVKKGESCVRQVKNGLIIAADTIVYFKGKIIGKPENMTQARLVLRTIQGEWHTVYTGVSILKIASGRVVKKTVLVEKTRVHLKPLTKKEIEGYFRKVNPLDKAGAYAIQSSHGGIVQEIKGLFSNAVGLPVEKILKTIS